MYLLQGGQINYVITIYSFFISKKMNRIRLSKYVAFTFLFAVLFKICFLNAPTGQSQEEEIDLTLINVTEKSTASSSIAKPSLKYQVIIFYPNILIIFSVTKLN